jgi:outer membrane immunogenic protein
MKRAWLMRSVICAGVLLALAPPAFAGDFDILRGTEPAYHWGGFYGGVQGGYSSSVVNFGPGAGPDIGFILRQTTIEADQQISQWPVLNGDGHPQSTSYGAFVGYNFEWQGLILGVEADYLHVSLSGSSTGGLTRSFTDSGNLPAGHHYFYTLTASGQASLSMSNIATFRARAGWEAGNFLPYAFAGMAFGRANVSSSANISYRATDFPDSEQPPLTPLPNLCFNEATALDLADPACPSAAGTYGTTTTGAFAYGADLGFGVDIAVMQHVFVRGELEYIYFAPINEIHMTVSSARVGIGYKF